MLEQLSQLFYDPLIFWGAPLVLALAGAGWRRLKSSRRRHDSPTHRP